LLPLTFLLLLFTPCWTLLRSWAPPLSFSCPIAADSLCSPAPPRTRVFWWWAMRCFLLGSSTLASRMRYQSCWQTGMMLAMWFRTSLTSTYAHTRAAFVSEAVVVTTCRCLNPRLLARLNIEPDGLLRKVQVARDRYPEWEASLPFPVAGPRHAPRRSRSPERPAAISCTSSTSSTPAATATPATPTPTSMLILCITAASDAYRCTNDSSLARAL